VTGPENALPQSALMESKNVSCDGKEEVLCIWQKLRTSELSRC
jgi:hypothetical protein